LRELVEPALLIEAADEDAQRLAVNAVCLGRSVVLCHASAALRQQLEARGYRVQVVPLGAFNRSGGAAFCLTLRLDTCTTAAPVRLANCRELRVA